ncbi:MAG: cation-translocating P-type ATPase [Cyanobacteria bacterium J06635_1]
MGIHPQQPWHTLSVDEVVAQLGSHARQGLSAPQVTQRQAEYGPNELKKVGGRSRWRILFDQFTNIMLLMLIAVAIISAVLDFRASAVPKDAIAIFAIVILNAVLGYLQESRAEKALEALKALSSPDVTVVRDGKPQEIPALALVPGDVVLLEAGDQIAADGRLIEAAQLQVRESALTGEATAVSKKAQQTLAPKTELADRGNLTFQGTEVVNGRGQMMVTATGMQTELGNIAGLLQSVKTEATPLQQRMGQLGNTLVFGSLVLVALVVFGGVFAFGRQAFEELLTVSLSMAVAVVPEGLPAVITVTLALGTQRMVQRHALIRRLPAVETLGSVTTICSDKTGTLTQNKMVVQSIHTVDQSLAVNGDGGYAPDGHFCPLPTSAKTSGTKTSKAILNKRLDPMQHPAVGLLLLDCLLCNDAVLQKENGEWAILGDPTEGALVTLAGKAGLLQASHPWERRIDFPFSSERKRMSVVVDWSAAACAEQSPWHPPSLQGVLATTPYGVFAKGSPEILLEQCDRIQTSPQIAPLAPTVRTQIQSTNEQLASKGKRVLGFAYKPLETIPSETEVDQVEADLIWLGLVGMIDAPRPEVKDAVKRCQAAGIRPMMITGDHPLTAQALAEDLGIAQSQQYPLTGRELEVMEKADLETAVRNVSVYARVSPEHKLRIVQALQSQNQIVAMTGDGVNDAPALKQAEIGIAMGITGTDVSKEASDMVLLDDNFASIVAATEEGRVVYSNIRRFVKYILGSNIGEVLTIALSPILLPILDVPLTPLQILWMNLVTDGFPALALAVEPAEPNVMDRPPHHPKESIFARGLGLYMVRVGIIFTLITVTLMVWAFHYTHADGYPSDPNTWKTMVFTMLCLAQMGHAISVRSHSRLAIELNPFSNPFVLAAVVITTALQLMLIYVEPLRQFFGTNILSGQELAVCFGFSTLLFVWIELEKMFVRWVLKKQRID